MEAVDLARENALLKARLAEVEVTLAETRGRPTAGYRICLT